MEIDVAELYAAIRQVILEVLPSELEDVIQMPNASVAPNGIYSAIYLKDIGDYQNSREIELDIDTDELVCNLKEDYYFGIQIRNSMPQKQDNNAETIRITRKLVAYLRTDFFRERLEELSCLSVVEIGEVKPFKVNYKEHYAQGAEFLISLSGYNEVRVSHTPIECMDTLILQQFENTTE